jgi:flagellar biosynthetic protein FliQ
MDAMAVMEIGRQALIVFFKISMPIMLASMIVGLIVSLFQALTQIQEMTLTFVPKVIVICLALIFLMPFIMSTLIDFNEELSRRIIEIGQGNDDE